MFVGDVCEDGWELGEQHFDTEKNDNRKRSDGFHGVVRAEKDGGGKGPLCRFLLS